MASAIAAELPERWWRERRFAKTRARYEGRLHSPQSALKAEASEYLGQTLGSLPESGPLSAELDLLRNVVIHGVITTNFDPLLETLFTRVLTASWCDAFTEGLGREAAQDGLDAQGSDRAAADYEVLYCIPGLREEERTAFPIRTTTHSGSSSPASTTGCDTDALSSPGPHAPEEASRRPVGAAGPQASERGWPTVRSVNQRWP
ncbi:MAG TPA: hypothetical protein VF533_19815 [Solirubrobacteraceae bacterium]